MTSPGYPYNKQNSGHKGKGPFIMRDGDSFVYDSTFLSYLEECDAKLRNGEQIEVIYADCLKDELRPIEKVEQGKTRLFSGSPLHLLMLIRRYFLPIVQYIQSQCSEKPVAVGINPHSLEWTKLRLRLAKTAQSVIAGDFSNYDGKLPAFVMKTALKWINKWFDDGEVNKRVRELLFEHMYNATRIHGTIIYKVCDGNPSGNPLTSIINSLCNIIMCYTILTREFHCQINEFEMVVYGDDNVITVMRENLKCSDLTPFFQSYFGMDYTHWTKNEEALVRADTLDTISFISRGFVLYNSIYLAPLPMDTIKEMMYWHRGTIGATATVLATAQSFLSEIFHYGQEEHKVWSTKLLVAVNRRMGPDIAKAIEEFNYPWSFYYRRNYLSNRALPMINHEIDQSEDI